MGLGGFSIGEVAKATGLSVKTIRYYEQIGLVPKVPRHDGSARTGGNRVYTEADLGRLQFINQARTLDLGLNDIRRLLTIAEENGCPGDNPEYRLLLTRHLDEIDKRITHLRGLRSRLQALMSRDRPYRKIPCSWNTCECLQPDLAAIPAGKRRPGKKVQKSP